LQSGHSDIGDIVAPQPLQDWLCGIFVTFLADM
jgi:hypothetical protein